MGHSVREEVWWVMAIIIVILLGFNGEAEGCLKEEREALMKLKEAFNYPNGSSLPSWNNQIFSDCCTWEAVECDNSTHRVIRLLLSYKRPYELGDIKWSLNVSSFLPFHSLQDLYLDGNYLSELLGDFRLVNLEALDLRENMLREFPHFDLSHSRNLKHLWLQANYLEGCIPEAITSITSLTELILSRNNLRGPLPQQGGLCNLKNLISLGLSNNEFEGQLPACLGNLTSLRSLSLGGIFPSSLPHTLRSLRAISLTDDNFSGSFSLSLLANHSNLDTFFISCSNANLKLETENPPFIPSFQFRTFKINNCTLNEANNKAMPTFLLHQYNLLFLELGYLNISGTFPSWLLTNNTGLYDFNLTHNLFTGPFELNSTSKLLQMESFDISSNPIRDEIPSHIGFIFPNLISLDMSSTSLQGCFPSSIGEMRQLNDLDLSNNNLSGYLPQEFGQGNNELRLLKLSNNHLSGPCLPIGSNFTSLLFLDLNNNNFKGKLKGGVMNCTELIMLDIGANQLSGELPNWIGNLQHLSYLILSKNSLTGSLPESFCNLTELIYLDLSKNKFTGSLPICLNFPLLRYLHLQSNHFKGPLPSTLAKSPLLLTLNLMNNNFSGQVSRLNGSFLSLSVLMLKGNKLEGSIPIRLCELKNIRLLDLSQNKLSGAIPYCLNNITFGKIDARRETGIGHFIVSWTRGLSTYTFNLMTGGISMDKEVQYVTSYKDRELEVEVKFTTKRRYESYKGRILNFMSGLDLSSNQLIGEIPSQLGYLSTIHALNLSNNQLKGPIPETFSSLRQIESLDLSHNNLIGHIPAQLIQLYFLSTFLVADNNLSEMTPDMKNQFATFDSTSYEGNPFLCGPPLQKSCLKAGRNKQPHDHLEGDDFRDAFLWSFAGAFGVFFIGIITVLYLNPYICNYRLLILERAVTSYLYEWWQHKKTFQF